MRIENLALRQQLAMYQRTRPRPLPDDIDRAFWIAMRSRVVEWASLLVVVKPATVVRWHRQGFRYYWRWKSRARPGRPALDNETRELIRRMARDNGWRAPRIQKELTRIGIEVHVDTVRRYMPRLDPDPAKQESWRTFLASHREVLAGMDFFVVPTVTFRLLYGFFIIHHGRRLVLHVGATYHPSAAWVCQQLREAFPFDAVVPRYLIFDRDSIFSRTVADAIRSIGAEPVRTAYQSPWQNPVAERWIGNLRRELLDRVIVLNERHVQRLVQEYIAYYNADRGHTTLDGDSPAGRAVQHRPSKTATVIGLPRVRGLHHRYEWRDAA